MPIFTVERAYYALVTNKVRVEAETPEKAMRLAMESSDWETVSMFHEGADTFVSEIWEGTDTDEEPMVVPIPDDLTDPFDRLDRANQLLAGIPKPVIHKVDADPYVRRVDKGGSYVLLWSLLKKLHRWDDDYARTILELLQRGYCFRARGLI